MRDRIDLRAAPSPPKGQLRSSWPGCPLVLLAATILSLTSAQVPDLEQLSSTWQAVRMCRPHAADVLPCPAGGNLSTTPWGPGDGTPCEDAGCCVMPSDGPATAPRCFAPNGDSLGSRKNQTAYGAFQQAPSLSQPGATLSVDYQGDVLGIDCFTAPPYAGKCGDPGGGLLLPHAGESFGLLTVDGVASAAAATGLQTQWMPHEVTRNATIHRHLGPNDDGSGSSSSSSSSTTLRASSSVRMAFNSQTILLRLRLEPGEASSDISRSDGPGASPDPMDLEVGLAALVDIPTKPWGWDVYRPQSSAGFTTALENATTSGSFPISVTSHPASSTYSAAAVGAGTTATPVLRRDGSTGKVSATWSGLDASSKRGIEIQLVLVVGRSIESVSSQAAALAAEFESAWAAARDDWSRWWHGVFDPTAGSVPSPLPFEGRLPVLDTDDAAMKRVYYMNVAALLGNAKFINAEIASQQGAGGWANQTVFVTGGPVCAPSILIIWDTTLNAVLLSLLQPSMFAEYIDRWLDMGLHDGLAFDIMSNKGIGKWYAFNDIQVFRGMDTLARFAGPAGVVKRRLGAKPVYQWMVDTATAWQQLVAPKATATATETETETATVAADALADYGENTNLLECVPTYTHKVASLNAANAWMMRQAALVLEGLGNNQTEAERLRQSADNVSSLVRTKLYVPPSKLGDNATGGYWQCEQPGGQVVPVRHVIDFNTAGAALHEDLTAAQRGEMVAFMRRELQTPHWMRALSLQDLSLRTPSANSNRKDHGPLGAYDGWLGETIHTLSLFGEYGVALDMVRSMAAAYSDGPGGQAHQVFTPQAAASEETRQARPPLKAAADQQFFEMSGAVTANRIITGLFGVDPPLSLNATVAATSSSSFSSSPFPEAFLRDAHVPRGFTGKLTGVLLHGRPYTVESGPAGLTIRAE